MTEIRFINYSKDYDHNKRIVVTKEKSEELYEFYEAMFLALAALRDDTDKDQWFTDGTDWAIWREDSSFRGKLIAGFEFHYLPSNTNYNKYHKATAKEIIEHFTMKGGAE